MCEVEGNGGKSSKIDFTRATKKGRPEADPSRRMRPQRAEVTTAVLLLIALVEPALPAIFEAIHERRLGR